MSYMKKPTLVETIGTEFQVPVAVVGKDPTVYENLVFSAEVVPQNDLSDAQLVLYKELIIAKLRREAVDKRRTFNSDSVNTDDIVYIIEQMLVQQQKINEAIAYTEDKKNSVPMLNGESMITKEPINKIAERVIAGSNDFLNVALPTFGIVEGIRATEETKVNRTTTTVELEKYEGPNWNTLIADALEKLKII